MDKHVDMMLPFMVKMDNYYVPVWEQQITQYNVRFNLQHDQLILFHPETQNWLKDDDDHREKVSDAVVAILE